MIQRKDSKDIHDDGQKNGTEIDEYDFYYGPDAVNDPVPGPLRIKGPLSRRPSIGSVIPALLLSFLFVIFTFLFTATGYRDILQANGAGVLTGQEYWRLVTALFTHSDMVHLMSNLPFFVIFGFLLYDYFGILLFPVLSLTAGIISNAVTVYIYPPGESIVGASGMVYAMVAIWLVLYMRHDTGSSVPVRILRAAGFALAVLIPETINPSTSYLAHAAGFVSGLLLGLAALPFSMVRTGSTQKENITGTAD